MITSSGQDWEESLSQRIPIRQTKTTSHKIKLLTCVLSCSLIFDSLLPYGLQPARLLYPLDSPARILEWVAMPFSRGKFLDMCPIPKKVFSHNYRNTILSCNNIILTQEKQCQKVKNEEEFISQVAVIIEAPK